MTMLTRSCTIAVLVVGGCILGDEDPATVGKTKGAGSPNGNGAADTFFTKGPLDRSNPFFVSIGVNGRTCESCHQQTEGWGIAAAGVQKRFDATEGLDPIFRLNDGANSPVADVSTLTARRAAFSMLRTKGLIRVGIGIPPGADFRLKAVDDPYGFATTAELSLFRRPLPTTNLAFLPTVMWDGRETFNPADLQGNLAHQAASATLGHAQAMSTDTSQMAAIVDFETGLFSAQISFGKAGDLDAGPHGGPEFLSGQEFYIGINDPLGGNPRGIPFTSNAFTLFDAWKPPVANNSSIQTRTREQIYRGQQLFNNRTIMITGVNGLNDVLGVASISGTCTTCHDTPNVGNHSVPLPIDIGIASEARRTTDLPLYTLERISDGAIVKTTDPGRALITGRFADIGKFKGPILRSLSSRAPYFHNGSAATLRDAVTFYNTRFAIGLTSQEIDDIAAFLGAL